MVRWLLDAKMDEGRREAKGKVFLISLPRNSTFTSVGAEDDVAFVNRLTYVLTFVINRQL